MKRGCMLCLNKYHYRMVKKYAHGLQLCAHCEDLFLTMVIAGKT